MLTVSFLSRLKRSLLTIICAQQLVRLMAFPGVQQRTMMKGSIWTEIGGTVQMDARLKVEIGQIW